MGAGAWDGVLCLKGSEAVGMAGWAGLWLVQGATGMKGAVNVGKGVEGWREIFFVTELYCTGRKVEVLV
jgi:hypothetical protein